MVGCHGMWDVPNHALFQAAHVSIFISYLAPPGTLGVLFLHGTLVNGFLLLTLWAVLIVCSLDIFFWNFAFMIINCLQMFTILYKLRPIKFSDTLEEVYTTIFKPLDVPRYLFQKLVSKEYAKELTLDQGENYATAGVTRADRLGLLVSGTANVMYNGKVLHNVLEKQFLDSPEFESHTKGEDKFHVDIVAGMPCRYIFWQRQALEHIFTQEPYLAHVMGSIIGRDITNKLYCLNEKVRVARGSRIDIRLPSVSHAIRSSLGRSPSDSSQEFSDKARGSPMMMANCDEVAFEEEEDVFEENEPTETTKINVNGSAKVEDTSV